MKTCKDLENFLKEKNILVSDIDELWNWIEEALNDAHCEGVQAADEDDDLT